MIAIFGVVGGIYVRREYFAAGSDAAAPAAGAVTPLEVGRPAPDFTLDTRDGTVRLSDLAGRAVIVNFWATWCGPCRQEMPDLDALQRAHADAGDLTVLAVNVTDRDTRSAANAFIDEYGFTFPVAFDDTGAVSNRYAVLGLPASFFVDPSGILRARTYGPLSGQLLADGLAAVGVTGG